MNGVSENLTQDDFLGGALRIWQPKKGYRAGTDPVFLAAAVPAHAGQSVLELGCGVGVASLCLARRVEGLHLTGVEIQEPYAELARRNGLENQIKFDVHTADLRDLPPTVHQQSFDHVIANPPYLQAGKGTGALDPGKETSFREETPLKDWIAVGLKRLKPRGHLSIIHLAERLPRILAALEGVVGDIRVKPLAGREGRSARLVIVQARKGSKGAFCLCEPLILHVGSSHDTDRDSYSSVATAILRAAAPLDL